MMVTAREAYSIWKRDFRRGRLLGDYSDFNATFRDMAYRSGLIPLPPGWKLPLWSMLGGPLGGGGMGYVLGRGAGAAAAGWWLSGGVSAANAIAVYQPIGAASLAASYTNLANPGTYDAAPGTAPTFDTATGWTFNGSTQYLTTSITPVNNQTWSALIRFSDTTNNAGVMFGHAATAAFQITPRYSNLAIYSSGGSLTAASSLANGVIGMAGNVAYRNGSAETGTIASGAGTFAAVMIGARSNASNVANALWIGKIQAVAIYNTTLSAAQVAAISSAMSGL